MAPAVTNEGENARCHFTLATVSANTQRQIQYYCLFTYLYVHQCRYAAALTCTELTFLNSTPTSGYQGSKTFVRLRVYTAVNVGRVYRLTALFNECLHQDPLLNRTYDEGKIYIFVISVLKQNKVFCLCLLTFAKCRLHASSEDLLKMTKWPKFGPLCHFKSLLAEKLLTFNNTVVLVKSKNMYLSYFLLPTESL